MAVLASMGVFVTCILAPLALVRQTMRKHASSERLQRSRVALLTNTYKDEFHYWEAVDLSRKLLLTSVVLLVGPDTVLQLWFVTATGLVFLVLFLALAPYRDEVLTPTRCTEYMCFCTAFTKHIEYTYHISIVDACTYLLFC